jgi:hypothetical protein
MEGIKIGNTESRPAPAGRDLLRIILVRGGRTTGVKRQGRAIGCELGPSGRFEFEGQPENIPIERHSPLHVADKHNRIVHSHANPPSSRVRTGNVTQAPVDDCPEPNT